LTRVDIRYGLSEETIRRIIEVFTSYVEIEAAALYGSRVKGNFKPGSDRTH
jgi:predicted nucleotidyltransferase